MLRKVLAAAGVKEQPRQVFEREEVAAVVRSMEHRMEDSLVAYSLSQVDFGWIWRLVDEMGEIIADGAAPDQPTAERRMLEAFYRTCGVGPAASMGAASM